MRSDDAPYKDVPGTYVMDGRHYRKGYALNSFCQSLLDEKNREAFKADEAAYLDRFKVTEEQKQAVLDRDWLRMLQLGGNIFYTLKLAILDGRSMQYLGGQMSGVSEDTFRQMMLDGGRPIEGNRSRKDWEQ